MLYTTDEICDKMLMHVQELLYVTSFFHSGHVLLNSSTAFLVEIKQTKMTSTGQQQKPAHRLSSQCFSVHPASSTGKIPLFTSKDCFNTIGTKHFIPAATSTAIIRKGLGILRTGCEDSSKWISNVGGNQRNYFVLEGLHN